MNTKNFKILYHIIFSLLWTLIFIAGVGAMIVSPVMESQLEYPLTALMFVILGSLFRKYPQVFSDERS